MDRIRMQLLIFLLIMIRNTLNSITVICLMAPYASDKAINFVVICEGFPF